MNTRKPRVDFKTERNIEIYKDVKSRKYRDWELVSKWKLSKQRISQICHEVEAFGLA